MILQGEITYWSPLGVKGLTVDLNVASSQEKALVSTYGCKIFTPLPPLPWASIRDGIGDLSFD